MITAKALAACMLLAAQTYQVPPAVLIGIMHVEGGAVGQQVGPNSNGTYDLGPMQINSLWVPQLARSWNVDENQAYGLLRDDGCVNVRVSAWILRRKIKRAGSLYKGIAYYHSATPGIGSRYAKKVVRAMYRKGLIQKKKVSAVSKPRLYAER